MPDLKSYPKLKLSLSGLQDMKCWFNVKIYISLDTIIVIFIS